MSKAAYTRGSVVTENYILNFEEEKPDVLTVHICENRDAETRDNTQRGPYTLDLLQMDFLVHPTEEIKKQVSKLGVLYNDPECSREERQQAEKTLKELSAKVQAIMAGGIRE